MDDVTNAIEISLSFSSEKNTELPTVDKRCKSIALFMLTYF